MDQKIAQKSAVHATFTLERIYDVSPARAFKAWSDPKAKGQWFRGPREWGEPEYRLDFRIGGREISRVTPKDGTLHAYDAYYWDIVDNQRIVYSYDMHIGAQRISVSQATVQFKSQGTGTRVIFTEQAVFLDGYDDAGSRERGTAGLLEALGAWLKTQAAAPS